MKLWALLAWDLYVLITRLFQTHSLTLTFTFLIYFFFFCSTCATFSFVYKGLEAGMNPCWTPFLISSSVLHQNDLIGSFWSALAKNNWSGIGGKNNSYIYFEQAITFLIKQLYLACLNEQCNYTQSWNQLSRCLCLAWNRYSINPVMGFLRAVIRISNRSCTVLSFHCYLCLPGLDSESLKPVPLSGWPFLLNHLILPRTCGWASPLKKTKNKKTNEF